MDRRACCAKEGVKRGAWTATEDRMLASYIEAHGEGRWREAPQRAGLRRCGKSCRLRWLNYLRPNIKRGNISDDEEELIIRLHNLLGNRWSLIAGRLPGRTDNEIKNYWNSTLGKKAGAGAGGKQGVAAANHEAGSGPARAGPADAGVGGKQGVAAANHTAASRPAGAGPTDASASTGAEAAPAVCAPKAVRCTGGFFFRPETPPPGACAETVRVTGNDCSGGSGLSFAEPFFSGDDWMEDVRALASFLECEEEWV